MISLLKTALMQWAENKIDTLFAGRQALKPVAYYLKNGVSNMLDKYDEHINRSVNSLLLFVGDKNGHIDKDKLIDDMAGIFKEIEPRSVEWHGFTLTYGRGQVVVALPDNPLLGVILPWEDIRFTTEDLLELKELLG